MDYTQMKEVKITELGAVLGITVDGAGANDRLADFAFADRLDTIRKLKLTMDQLASLFEEELRTNVSQKKLTLTKIPQELVLDTFVKEQFEGYLRLVGSVCTPVALKQSLPHIRIKEVEEAPTQPPLPPTEQDEQQGTVEAPPVEPQEPDAARKEKIELWDVFILEFQEQNPDCANKSVKDIGATEWESVHKIHLGMFPQFVIPKQDMKKHMLAHLTQKAGEVANVTMSEFTYNYFTK